MLRRELLSLGRSDLIIGTRFITPIFAAFGVLVESGTPFTPYEDQLRALRLREILADPPLLEYFSRDLFATTKGWEAAFASAIDDLESSSKRPDDLPTNDGRFRDLARIWSAVEKRAGQSWSRARIFLEAARILEATPEAWPYDGPSLIAIGAYDVAAQTEFLKHIPSGILAIHGSRHDRKRQRQRINELFGQRDVDLGSERPLSDGQADLDILKRDLFASSDSTSAKQRRTHTALDGSVYLERFGGVEDELRAAMQWVVREVVEYKTQLEDLAILVPHRDPWCGFVEEYVRALRWPDAECPVSIAGGGAIRGSAEGTRILVVIRALEMFLGAEQIAALLPLICLDGADGGRKPSPSEATRLAYSLGTAGGSTGNPQGALEWSEATRRRAAELRRRIVATGASLELSAAVESDPALRDLRRQLALIDRVTPALDQLCEAAKLIATNTPLPELWSVLFGFIQENVSRPITGRSVLHQLDEELRFLFEDSCSSAPKGVEALRFIEAITLRLRSARKRFGTPSIFVGTIEDAFGLAFSSVRVLGMSEGIVPIVPAEDPVLPTQHRVALGLLVPRVSDRATVVLCALERIVRDTRDRISFSCSDVGLDGVSREPSSVFLDIRTALGRALSGEVVSLDAASFERVYCAPARADRMISVVRWPISERSWLDRLSRGQRGLRASDRRADHARLRTLLISADGPMHGAIDAQPGVALQGLTRDVPISLSKLRELLECPHRFLLKHVLRLRPPSSARSSQDVDALAYGDAFHLAAQRFAERSWPELVRTGVIDSRAIDDAVDHALEPLFTEWPLAGDLQRSRTKARLHDDLLRLVEHDLAQFGARDQILVEQSFGEAGGVEVSAGARKLYLRGRVDRIEQRSGATFIRDLKTGRPQNKTDGPELPRDLQIAGYAAIARALSGEWNLSTLAGAGYVFVGSHGIVHRAFEEDLSSLDQAWSSWSSTAAALLAAADFPRTPKVDDCRYCELQPVCGSSAAEKSRLALLSAEGARAAFRDVRLPAQRSETAPPSFENENG